jgi:hypothetical protein
MGKESAFQSQVIKRLEKQFPGCMVWKMDSSYRQGTPDLLVLYGRHWAMLECKRNSSAPHQPNQDYYVKKLNDMSYASVVYPENFEEVMDGIQRAFGDQA